MTESSRTGPSDSHPRAASPDEMPTRLSLGELVALFPEWVVQQQGEGAYTATRRRGSATRVVAAHTPAELAAAIARIEQADRPVT